MLYVLLPVPVPVISTSYQLPGTSTSTSVSSTGIKYKIYINKMVLVQQKRNITCKHVSACSRCIFSENQASFH